MFCAAHRVGRYASSFVNQNCLLGPARARAPIGRFTTDHSVSCGPPPCPVGQPALWAVCYAGSDRDRERGGWGPSCGIPRGT
ncbi:hypothetical protein P167DRAFT_536381 [Morchella conica CCBAS932]|uniref:Uncharacterized protein n=1 Tax=Morchella conica CCBAS932 TaxID=1392247 RepID=A0A3N4KQL4_9PEZI|nr:hypothetical protein P167DRAFT_536381 [Morchella conica CCBAS932]